MKKMSLSLCVFSLCFLLTSCQEAIMKSNVEKYKKMVPSLELLYTENKEIFNAVIQISQKYSFRVDKWSEGDVLIYGDDWPTPLSIPKEDKELIESLFSLSENKAQLNHLDASDYCTTFTFNETDNVKLRLIHADTNILAEVEGYSDYYNDIEDNWCIAITAWLLPMP